jgi:hypothetical protein
MTLFLEAPNLKTLSLASFLPSLLSQFLLVKVTRQHWRELYWLGRQCVPLCITPNQPSHGSLVFGQGNPSRSGGQGY